MVNIEQIKETIRIGKDVNDIEESFNDIGNFVALKYLDGVTVLIPSGNELNTRIANVTLSKSKNAKLIKGLIRKLTTIEVEDIVLEFGSKFREHYKENFNTKYFELLDYLEVMNKERRGEFSRHLVKDAEMRDILDTTFKLTDDHFARFAKKINGQDVLIIDDTISRGQSIREVCDIILESYSPKSITVLTLLSKLD